MVDTAELALSRVREGRPAKSFIAVGPRGVGKTVILNKVQEIAEGQGYQSAYIEAHDDMLLAGAIAKAMRPILLSLNRTEGTKELSLRALGALRSFASVFRVNYQGFELGVDPQEGIADSGDLAADLPDLLIAIGQAAKSRGTAVALIIDDVQYLASPEMSALIMAIHRVNQKQLPVIFFGAGLPQLRGKMGDSKCYVERLFDFPIVDALNYDDARKAIEEPINQAGALLDVDAAIEIFRATHGYPYFLQEWGHVVWLKAQQSPITTDVVRAAHDDAIRRLDESFFRVRLDRMTPTEKRYMRALAELGPGAHRSGDIAKTYGAKVTTIAPTRSALIAKGMIYSPNYGDTIFTVPLFDEFMRREMALPT